jgi:hypothetical protein
MVISLLPVIYQFDTYICSRLNSCNSFLHASSSL